MISKVKGKKTPNNSNTEKIISGTLQSDEGHPGDFLEWKRDPQQGLQYVSEEC
ncbi:MAG: hypothetical protein U5K84_11540 [Alkalibacterium sp.]|nr:hypothetical protein [Alkalibacterium sp.]